MPGDEDVSLDENVVITSAVIFDYFRTGDEIYKVSVASGNPDDPAFLEVDPSQEENLPFMSGFPSAGTMYTFRFEDMTTSAAASISDQSDALTLFPNPGNTELTIEYPTPGFDYEIRNAAGYLVQKGKANRSARVSTANWSAGVYFIYARKGQEALSEMWLKYE